MSKTTRARVPLTAIALTTALLVSACSGTEDTPESSPSPEAIEQAEATAELVADAPTEEPVSEFPANLVSPWDAYSEDERQRLCTSIGIIGEEKWMESMSDSEAATPEEHRDFLLSMCADVGVSESLVVDTMEATWDGYSETRRDEACSELDTMGEAVILQSWRSELGLVKDTPEVDEVILDLWGAKCDGHEGALAGEAKGHLEAAWSDMDFDARTEFCDEIGTTFGAGGAARIQEAFPDVPTDAGSQVYVGFKEDACSEHEEVVAAAEHEAAEQAAAEEAERVAAEEAEQAEREAEEEREAAEAREAWDAMTVSQQNAIGSARSYLNYTSFSRSSLIGQLEYEGYSTSDATFAVDHITVDWNEQAAQSAKDYLDYTHFSRSGLIDQLLYEGFTRDQAEYGVSQTGL